MGICWSCLTGRTGDEDDEDVPPLLDENTPLLRETQQQQPTGQPEESVDKVKRDQTLNSIVNLTGENLIDVSSVAQPDGNGPGSNTVRSIGSKSANEYKRALAELKFHGTSPTNSSSSPHSPQSVKSSNKGSVNSHFLPKKSSSSQLSDADLNWLKQLGNDANKAIKGEPEVKPSGQLVLKFE